MNTSTIISLSGGFLKLVGEVLADVKRQDLASVDAELLRLKRKVLAEKLEEFKISLDTSANREKSETEQNLISKGLANSTVRQSSLRAIERDAATELERATREYNRAIEEIALIERKLEMQNRPPFWKKVLRRFGFFKG
ncbi:hypothetical protein BH11PLA2_BH11PLA2_27840 [soil metagenome]